MQFPIRDPENYRRLQTLPPDEAIDTYLKGGFTIGEDEALLDAIQKGLSLPLKRERIGDILLECSEDEKSVAECKSQLIAAAL